MNKNSEQLYYTVTLYTISISVYCNYAIVLLHCFTWVTFEQYVSTITWLSSHSLYIVSSMYAVALSYCIVCCVWFKTGKTQKILFKIFTDIYLCCSFL
jgi:hypothetical protein